MDKLINAKKELYNQLLCTLQQRPLTKLELDTGYLLAKDPDIQNILENHRGI